MNIQIFGTPKSSDTRKAQRWFKERRIPFQFINMKEKSMSRGELTSVINALGGIDRVVDENAKDADALALFKYTPSEDKLQRLLDSQQIITDPIVRNGRQASAGYAPDTWEQWRKNDV